MCLSMGRVVSVAVWVAVALPVSASADPEPEVSLEDLKLFEGFIDPNDVKIHQLLLDDVLGAARDVMIDFEDELAMFKAVEELARLEEIRVADIFGYGFEVIEFVPMAPSTADGGLDLTDTSGDGWGCDDDALCASFPSGLDLAGQDSGGTWQTRETPTGERRSTRTYASENGDKHHEYFVQDASGAPVESGEHTERADGSSHVSTNIYHDDNSVTHVEAEFDEKNEFHGMRAEHETPPAEKVEKEKIASIPAEGVDAGGYCPLMVAACQLAAAKEQERITRWIAGSGCVRSRDPESSSSPLVVDEDGLIINPDPNVVRGNPSPSFMHLEFPVFVLPPRPGQ